MASRDDILTISDVTRLFKVTQKTVYSLTQKGDLPGFKVGGQWRFRRTTIDSWIDRGFGPAMCEGRWRLVKR